MLRVSKNVIEIHGLRIPSEEIAEYFSAMPEEEREHALVTSVEVGVKCLRLSRAGREVDFVRRELEKQVHEVGMKLARMPAEVTREMTKVVGTKEGQILAPLSGAIQVTEQSLNRRLSEVQGLLDPRRQDSALGKAMGTIGNLLDPKREGSIQMTLERAVQSLTASDGNLGALLSRTLEEKIKPLKEEVDRLSNEVMAHGRVQGALENTTAKGLPFEEDVVEEARLWSLIAGGAGVEHVGPDNKPGDVLVVLKPSGGLESRDQGVKVVIEAKSNSHPMGRRRIATCMSRAMVHRQGVYGVFVAQTREGLAKEVGDWAEIECKEGLVVACTVENLRTALRFVAAVERLRRLRASAPAADVRLIEAEVRRMRAALGRVRSIKSKATAITSNANAISGEVNELKKEVENSLLAIEGALTQVAAKAA